MEKNEAAVVPCKCPKHHRLFGVRFEKMNDVWMYTWAFEMKESSEYRNGYNPNVIKGNIMPTNDYPGCPYCGSKGFVICQCGKLSCHPSKAGMFTCEWCGNTGMLTEYDGSGFTSYEDR